MAYDECHNVATCIPLVSPHTEGQEELGRGRKDHGLQDGKNVLTLGVLNNPGKLHL